MDAIAKIVPLNEEQRTAALDAARRKIAGDLRLPDEPTRESFKAEDYQRLPARFAWWVNALSLFMLVAAFLPSAMRLHAIGLKHATLVLINVPSSYIAALCVVIMAEIGQVIFTLGATNARTVWGRAGMYAGAAICTAIALAGNAIAVGSHADDNLFTFLETFGPPVLVLLTSNILKAQAVGAIKAQHAAAAAFANAHRQWKTDRTNAEAAWQSAMDTADGHHSWVRLRANALREALRRANARSTVAIRELTDFDWRALIERELTADQWFARTEAAFAAPQTVETHGPTIRIERSAAALPMRARAVGSKAGKHTRELDGAIIENADGTHTATCPSCDRRFTKDSHRSAVGALVAHTKHAHRNTDA